MKGVNLAKISTRKQLAESTAKEMIDPIENQPLPIPKKKRGKKPKTQTEAPPKVEIEQKQTHEPVKGKKQRHIDLGSTSKVVVDGDVVEDKPKEVAHIMKKVDKYVQAQNEILENVTKANDGTANFIYKGALLGSIKACNGGDSLSDVLRFWSSAVSSPGDFFNAEQTKCWTTQTLFQISSDLIYGMFVEFVAKTSAKEISTKFETNMEVLPFNINHLEPEDREEFFKSKQEAMEAEKNGVCQTSKDRFWNCTKLIFSDTKTIFATDAANIVLLPPHFAMQRCIQRFYKRIEFATAVCHEKLSVIRSAYSSEDKKHFHILISPASTNRDSKESFMLAFRNPIAVEPFKRKDTLFVEMKNMRLFHPMFEEKCYFDLLFLCAILAQTENIFINFKFTAGRYFQYVLIYDDSLYLTDYEDADSSGTRTGCYSQNVKFFGPTDDTQLSMWHHEVFVPEDTQRFQKNLRDFMPMFCGLQLRMWFINDYRKWFFG